MLGLKGFTDIWPKRPEADRFHFLVSPDPQDEVQDSVDSVSRGQQIDHFEIVGVT
jgi:hypothetical protein